MRVLAVLSAAAMLSACITSTAPAQNATSVQKHTFRTEKFNAPGVDTGLLIIKRDTGMRGSSCIPLISLNGDHVAPINVGQKLELHLSAGRHSLHANPNKNCAAPAIETSVEIKKSQTTTYRLGFVKREMVFIPTSN